MSNEKTFITQRKHYLNRRSFLRSIGAAGLAAWGGASGIETRHSETGMGSPCYSGVSAVVLGSAQDGGVPHAGCRCDHCEAARNDPRLRRRSPCVALLHEPEGKAFLLDAGPDLPSQLEDIPAEWKKGRNPVDGILLTHAHIGHYLGLAHLGREVLATQDLPIKCSERMADFLRQNGPWSLLAELGNISIQPVKPGEEIELATGLSVKPIQVPHRAEFTDTLAFLASGPSRRLLYLPDIDRWDQLKPPIEEILAEVDIGLLDGTFYSGAELPGRDKTKIPHPPVAETAERLGAIAAKESTEIFFIHLNHSNLLLDSDGKLLGEIRGRGFDVADDGTTFAL